MPRVRAVNPVTIQIISIIRTELFLIVKIDCCLNFFYLPVIKVRIRFKSKTMYYLIFVSYLNKPVSIYKIFFLTPSKDK